MAPRSSRPPRPVKHETATVLTTGLMTPNMSMSSAISSGGSGTPSRTNSDATLKGEEHKENMLRRFIHDGLPAIQIDDDEAEAIKLRKLRSSSPSLVSLQYATPPLQPQPQPSLANRISMAPSVAPSIASRMPAPGASLELVGEKVNLLVDAIEELRKLGLKEIDTELPELVLVGDQSAGKSSLMGAIAEINLPKDSGMCTRCPANIKTSPAESWSCTVSLHEYYRYTQGPRREATANNPFPPWIENSTINIKQFKTISNKAELENILRWAQIALLNPSRDYRAFIPGTGAIVQSGLGQDHKHEADYSPNIVAIEIFGPRLPALSFYDLPGVFNSSANREERYLVKVFENMVKKYIRHEKALIICAMTMATDPANSRTFSLITDMKADKRTIGVLTMPDLLQTGSTHTDFDKLLRNQTYILPRGYFVTKQPGPKFNLRQNSDYHIQAREEEAIFFRTDARWREDGEWQAFNHRCGTKAIQEYLSQEFARLIVGSMGSIEEKIKNRVRDVDNKLGQLPDLPDNDNVQHIVRQSLQEFSTSVRSMLGGGSMSLHHTFLSNWSRLSNDFAEALHQMKPMFVYQDASDIVPPEVISLDDSDTESRASSTISSFSKKHGAPPGFATPPSKFARTTNGPSPSNNSGLTPASQQINHIPGSQHIARPKNESIFETPTTRRIAQPRKAKVTPFSDFLAYGKRFKTIGQIRDIISRHKRPGHPDNVPEAAREELCMEATQMWKHPLDKLVLITFAHLREAVVSILQRPEALGKYRQTDLFRESKKNILDFLDILCAEQTMNLNQIYTLETYSLFTLNNEVFSRYKAEELTILQQARRKHRVKCYIEKNAKALNKTLTEKDRETQMKHITDDQLGPDPFALEIDTAAYVRGYYKTAANRFADNLCQNIQGILFRKVQEQIPQYLETVLGLNSRECEMRCRMLMIEDHSEASARAALQEEKTKLTQAAARLEQLVEEFAFEPEPEDIVMENDVVPEEPFRRSLSILQPRCETAPPEDV